jgi:hypothetical protein
MKYEKFSEVLEYQVESLEIDQNSCFFFKADPIKKTGKKIMNAGTARARAPVIYPYARLSM